MTNKQYENLQALQSLAKENANFNGHKLTPWVDEVTIAGIRSLSTCYNTNCHCTATISLGHNRFEIIGTCIGTVCKGEDDHEPHLPFRTES